ncbi:MAG: Mur ligase family protein [Owenweeksia sp.]|nr:Mur ligase family protein [Owenweeksia sp.]
MLAAIFQESGYKTGLYTSPHLKDFRERIRINGQMIPEEKVVSFVKKNKNHFSHLTLSFFEMTVAMAFDYFAQEKVDIAILEVGMGGRLDSTNVVMPELSIITNISLDHTQYLGDTRTPIAREKAGIIKNDIPVVIGEHGTESDPVFREIAQQKNAPISFAEDEIPHYQVHALDLPGIYQEKNLRTCLAAVAQLQKKATPLSIASIQLCKTSKN